MAKEKALILRFSDLINLAQQGNSQEQSSSALYIEAVRNGFIGSYDEFISHLATVPKINGVELTGDITASDLGLVTKEDMENLVTIEGETFIITN